jgi:hypothetical protein
MTLSAFPRRRSAQLRAASARQRLAEACDKGALGLERGSLRCARWCCVVFRLSSCRVRLAWNG